MIKRALILISLLLFTALFATCTTKPAPMVVATLSLSLTTTNTVEASPTPTQWILPTFTAMPINTLTPLPTRMIRPVSLSPTSTPTVSPTPAPIVVAPPGLLYSDSKGQWQIAADGKSVLIITGTNLLLSPNGQMAIKSPDCCRCNCDGVDQLVNFTTGNSLNLEPELGNAKWSSDSRYIYYTTPRYKEKLSDIWLFDVATGMRHNLTNTPARDEDSILDWPANAEFLAFYSTPGIPDGAGWIGYLTIMHTDGTGYQVVSNDPVSSPAAFSPDGRTIAYAADGPWYYRVGSQPQRFPWKDFGLAKFKTMGFSSPSWSRDGKKIAWWMWSSDRPNNFEGIGLFDLEKGQVSLLDNFTQFVPDGWPSAVEWSPNGEKVLFYAQHLQGQEQQADGIWIADADGRNLRRLIDVSDAWYFCHWAWQPDGQWLAISCDEQKFAPGIWLIELKTGKLLKTNLPDGAQIRGWVNPQP